MNALAPLPERDGTSIADASLVDLNTDWLIGFQRAHFERAGTWRVRAVALQFAIGALALGSIFVDDHRALYSFAALTLILIAGLLWSITRQRRCREIAEAARRASLLLGGLGARLSPDILREMWKEKEVKDLNIEAAMDQTYYATMAPPGAKRLGQILHQSAFWTAFLQRKSAAFTWLLFWVSTIVSICILICAIPYAPKEIMISIGRSVFVVTMALLTQGLFDVARGHTEAATNLDDILGRIRTAGVQSFPRDELIHILTDYNSIVERAPLLFPGLYRKYRKDLNEQWKREPS